MLWPLLTRSEQQFALLLEKRLVGLGKRITSAQSMENVAAFEIAFAADAIHLLEALNERSRQRRIDLGFRPEIVLSFLAILVGVET